MQLIRNVIDNWDDRHPQTGFQLTQNNHYITTMEKYNVAKFWSLTITGLMELVHGQECNYITQIHSIIYTTVDLPFPY